MSGKGEEKPLLSGTVPTGGVKDDYERSQDLLRQEMGLYRDGDDWKYDDGSVCGGLWAPLKLIDEHTDKNRSMTWSELFYDLIFVTAIAHLGEEFKGGSIPVTIYGLYLVTVYGMWHGATVFACRFHRGELSMKLYFACHMIGMVGVNMNMADSYCGWNDSNCDSATSLKPLAYCATWIHLVETVGFIRVYHRYMTRPAGPEEKETNDRLLRQSRGRTILQLIVLVCWLLLALAVIPGQYCVIVFIVDVVLRADNFLVWTFIRLLNAPFGCIPESAFHYAALMPIHVDHYTERLGLVILIVLGESVDGIAVHPKEMTVAVYSTVFFGFLVVFALKLLYFDTMHPEEEDHIMNSVGSCHVHVVTKDDTIKKSKRNKGGERKEYLMAPTWQCSLWITLHQFLAMTLSVTGDCLALISNEEVKSSSAAAIIAEDQLLSTGPMPPVTMMAVGDGATPDYRTVLAYSVSLSLLISGYIGFAHKNAKVEEAGDRQECFRILDILQKSFCLLAAVIAFCSQFVDRADLDNLALITILSLSSMCVAAVSYFDECLTNEEVKEGIIAEITEQEHLTEELVFAMRDKIKDKTDAANKEIAVPIQDMLTALRLSAGGDVVRQMIDRLEEEMEHEPHIKMEDLIQLIIKTPANQATVRKEAVPKIQAGLRGSVAREEVKQMTDEEVPTKTED